MRGQLYFTVGLPRSGKSTFCDGWVRKIGVNPRAIIAGDDFRYALYRGAYIPEAEGSVFAAMDIATRALLNRGFDVIIDETCTTELTLRRYLKIDVNAKPYFINTPPEECKERAIKCGKEYLVGPIERMTPQFNHMISNWEDIYCATQEYCRMRFCHDNFVDKEVLRG